MNVQSIDVPIYVINLKRSPERLHNFINSARLHKIHTIHRFQGIDFKEHILTNSEKNKFDKRLLAHKRILSNHGIRKQAANVAKVKAQKKRAKTYERILRQRFPYNIASKIANNTVNSNINNTIQHKRVKK